VHELAEAYALLRHLRALLALLFDGVPEPAALAGPAGATLARCAGAVDFAELSADISQAAAVVRRWYDRLIEEPAARVQQEAAEQAGDPPA
jgi:glutathione S-transferase